MYIYLFLFLVSVILETISLYANFVKKTDSIIFEDIYLRTLYLNHAQKSI